MNIIRKNNAVYFLFINAGLWGSSYVWSKVLLGYLPHFSILFMNSLGSLLITVVMFHSMIGKIVVSTMLPSIAVSILLVISNTFFIFALQYTSSSSTAFIVQTSVIITPVIMAIIERKMPEHRIIMSAPVALLGLFLLTFDFKGFRSNFGDLLAVGNVLFFSFSLVGLKYNSRNTKPVQFTLIYHATSTIAFLVLALLLDSQYMEFKKMGAAVVCYSYYCEHMCCIIYHIDSVCGNKIRKA